MLTNKKEKRICDKYKARDNEGKVHCYECPLRVYDEEIETMCKAWCHYDRRFKKWFPDDVR